MAGEIIRLGDRTSHGGIVIEGSPADICMGKPIAFVGHKVQCPQCKGVFPIVEGALTTTFYGKGVALGGMRTACGAILLAGQITDVVQFGAGDTQARMATRNLNPTTFHSSSAKGIEGTSSNAETDRSQFDEKFKLLDAETGSPIPNAEYAIRRQSGEIEHGITDAEGHTHLLSTTASAEVIEIFV